MSSSPTDAPRGGGGAVGSSVDVTMPQMGVSVVEGTIVAWHKHVGDWVNADETLVEISTDKIDTEVPSPASGRVLEILAEVEETVAVGAPLARIGTDHVAGEPHPDEHLEQGGSAAPEGAEAGGSPAAEGASGAPAPARASDASLHHSPVVQRIAQREGVDLHMVQGTGRGGRVRKQDVLAYVEQGGREAGGLNGGGAPPLHSDSPYREQAPTWAAAPGGIGSGTAQESEEIEEIGAGQAAAATGAGAGEPLSRMRRAIAEHMLRSLHVAAHCTSVTEVDMSALEAERARLGLSYLPFVARCVIDALQEHPALNASLEAESLTRHREVHLGIAVSLGDEGLIVPVVHQAHELSHQGLATRIAELAERARAGQLTADEVQGGTFTITNPGGFGTLISTPIINQPQVAILDLEAVVKRPVVVTDADGGDSIAIRPMAYLCLSWDHRALDGALAAQFLATLRRRIEHWGGA